MALRKLFFIASILSLLFEIKAQNKKIDSMLLLLKVDKEDTIKLIHLNELCTENGKLSKNETSIAYGKKAFSLANKLALSPIKEISSAGKRGMASASNNIGINYMMLTNYPLALNYYYASVKIYLETGNLNSAGNIYNNIGNVYLNQGKYPEALKIQLDGLKIREQTKNKTNIATSLHNIGNIYYRQENYTEALKYYFQALKLRQIVGERFAISSSFHNLGAVYSDQHKYKEALKFYLDAIKIKIEISDKFGLSNTYINLGILYSEMGDNKSAKNFYNKALLIDKEIGSVGGEATALLNLAGLYISENNSKKAKLFANEALNNATITGEIKLAETAYACLTQVDSIEADFKSSLKNYKLYIVYRDSLINQESSKKITQTQMQYEFDKKTTTDSIKNAEIKKLENIKHNQEIATQKTYTYGGIIGFLIMIIVAIISFRAFKNKQKANLEIQKQKEIVEEKQKEILDSIYYARRIQRALITSEFYIAKSLKKLNK